MLYQFSPLVKAAIDAGRYIPVMSVSGVPLSMVRDAATGQFAHHAVGLTSTGIGLLNPLTAPLQMVMGAGQLYQGHKALQGIKALSASVATLQATTAVIGVGVAATAALSAVNLWQTLKLRQDIKQMRVEVRDGFINLNQALSAQGAELIEHILQVSEDVEFKAHRTILARAYGLFDKAMNRLQSAVMMSDLSLRDHEIMAARDMMFKALADYSNNQLMEGVGAVAYIRRRECVWAIEQAIAMTYQMQGQWNAVSERLLNTDAMIRQDALTVLDKIQTDDELDFLFPEMTKIHDHDLVAIAAWKNHVDWYQQLSFEEMKQLNEFIAIEQQDTVENSSDEVDYLEEAQAEYKAYDEIRQKSVPGVLHDSLVFLFDSEVRQNAENYIDERAQLEDLAALNQDNLCKASPLTIANLAWYFSARDESLVEDDAEENAGVIASSASNAKAISGTEC
jgi:uncharacterized protein YdaT